MTVIRKTLLMSKEEADYLKRRWKASGRRVQFGSWMREDLLRHSNKQDTLMMKIVRRLCDANILDSEHPDVRDFLGETCQ